MKNNIVHRFNNENTYFAAVYVLHCALPEQKVRVRVSLERSDELRFVQPLGVVVYRTQVRGSQVPDDGRVHAGKVHRAAGKVLAVQRDHCRYIGQGAVRTLAHATHCISNAVGVFHLHEKRHTISE